MGQRLWDYWRYALKPETYKFMASLKHKLVAINSFMLRRVIAFGVALNESSRSIKSVKASSSN